MSLSSPRPVGSKLILRPPTTSKALCCRYIVQLFEWCRKYGIRVNLDLHTIPGSQNGWWFCYISKEVGLISIPIGYNHSGRGGQINFLMGVMGIANAQRTLNYIRIITEFISQPQYTDVVPMFSIMNEALITVIGDTELSGL